MLFLLRPKQQQQNAFTVFLSILNGFLMGLMLRTVTCIWSWLGFSLSDSLLLLVLAFIEKKWGFSGLLTCSNCTSKRCQFILSTTFVNWACASYHDSKRRAPCACCCPNATSLCFSPIASGLPVALPTATTKPSMLGTDHVKVLSLLPSCLKTLLLVLSPCHCQGGGWR